MLEKLRTQRRAEDLDLAGRHGALREATEQSDLDLLVAWEPGRSLLDHAGLVRDLEELLGVKVDVERPSPGTSRR